MTRIRADRPVTLDGILSYSETLMTHEGKVILIAMVKRQRRVGPNVRLPIGRGELCRKLGMDPAIGLEAIRQLCKLDYLHREGEEVALIVNHPVCAMLELDPLAVVPVEDIAAHLLALSDKASTPERKERVDAATGAAPDPEPSPQAGSGGNTEGAVRTTAPPKTKVRKKRGRPPLTKAE